MERQRTCSDCSGFLPVLNGVLCYGILVALITARPHQPSSHHQMPRMTIDGPHLFFFLSLEGGGENGTSALN